MARLTSELVVSAIDRATAPLRAITASMASLRQMQERNNLALDAARGRMVDAAAAGFALYKSLSAPIEKAAAFGAMLEDIGQKAEIPERALPALGKRIRAIGLDTAQGATAVGKAVDFLMGMGASEDVSLEIASPIGEAATAYRAATEDLASATFAVVDNLKVPAKDAAYALDIMAAAGKQGGFELKDMAAEFPSITAAAQALGIKGTEGVADLVAALEVARKGTASGAEAANNMSNFMQKIVSKETIKNFKKFGINVTKELEKARKKGISPIEHMLDIINKRTKGGQADLVAQLFGDKEVVQFIRPLLANMEEYRRIREESLRAAGTVQADFDRRMRTSQGAMMRFSAQMENVGIAIGSALLPGLVAAVDKIIPLVEALARFADTHPEVVSGITQVAAGLVALRVAAAAARFSMLWITGGALSVGSAALRTLAIAARGAGVALATMRGLATGSAARSVAIEAAASARALQIQKAAAFQSALAMQGLARQGRVAGLSLADATKAVQATGREAAAAQVALAAANRQLIATGPAARAAALGLGVVRGALAALKVALISTGIGAILVGIGTAGAWIYSNWSGLKEMFIGVAEGIKTAFPAATGIINGISSAVGTLFGWLEKLTGPVDASAEEWRRFGVSVGQMIGETLAKIVAMPGEISAAMSNLGAQLYNAGYEAIQQLLDGMVAKFEELKKWVSSIPGLIRSAIGKIDLSNIISWPRVPSWLGGGGEAPASNAPGVAGARAAGGPVAGGRTYLVGEEGPELFTAPRSGQIIPNGGRAPRGVASASGGNTISVTINANTNASARDIAALVERSIEQTMRKMMDISGVQSDIEYSVA